MKKRIMFVMISLMLVSMVFVAATGQQEKSSAQGSGAKSVVEPVKDLPVNGIGATISTDVKGTPDIEIACIIKNNTNPYMVALGQGVEKAGRDMGVSVRVLAPTTQDSVEEQVRIMEDMIQADIDGFVLVPVDSNGIMPGVRKAKEANIPVATIGTPAAQETFLRTGVDYTETGYLVAKAVAEEIGGKGKVIIIEGPPGAQNAIERLDGNRTGFGEFPGIEIVASQTANFRRTEGMQVTENLLQAHPDVDAIVAANDESALGAIQALRAAGKTDVIVGGFDGNMDGAQAIKDGDMLISYNTDPFGSAYLATVYIVQHLVSGVEPPQYFVPFPSALNDPLITKENVEDYQSSIAWWK